MQACRQYEETLILDVLGELNDGGTRRDWESHLGSCDGCRRERVRMQQLMGAVRRAGTPSELSPQRADAMANRILWRLRNERRSRPEKGARRVRLVPALAAACALLITVVAGYRVYNQIFRPGNDVDAMLMFQLSQQDIEIIENLDLLKQWDTIEKLVNIEDLPANGQNPEPEAPATQGMDRDDDGKAYA